MKKPLLTLVALLFAYAVIGQVTFVVTSLPETTPEEDTIYITGIMNNWNPGDPDFALQMNVDENWAITLDAMPEGSAIEFKFTRGDWDKVEKGANGEELINRTFTFGNGDSVEIEILSWADLSSQPSTAAWNVDIMDEAFFMPQLDRERRIWIYLPPNYDSSDASFPVLYMHDGQNVFDSKTSFAEEWEVDETLNELYDEGFNVPIVVAIDNGAQHRTDEYTPFIHPDYGGGEADQYLDFLLETLKPHIDQHYRTLADRDNTGIMGSSLGGLVSTYGALKHQDKFSKSGSFSPAYWINNDSIWDFVAGAGKQENIRFYQNMGENEGAEMIEGMQMMDDSLKALGFEKVFSKIIAGGGHNEATWSDDFRSAYLWLFPGFALDVSEQSPASDLTVIPNPVGQTLRLGIDLPGKIDYQIYDLRGKLVTEQFGVTNTTVDVSALDQGLYLINVSVDGRSWVGRFVKQ